MWIKFIKIQDSQYPALSTSERERFNIFKQRN